MQTNNNNDHLFVLIMKLLCWSIDCGVASSTITHILSDSVDDNFLEGKMIKHTPVVFLFVCFVTGLCKFVISR